MSVFCHDTVVPGKTFRRLGEKQFFAETQFVFALVPAPEDITMVCPAGVVETVFAPVPFNVVEEAANEGIIPTQTRTENNRI